MGINHEVRQRMIELIQSWALLFEARSSELGYMMSTYRSLKHEGVQFPPEEPVAAAFVDSAAPPDWADSDVCMRCRTAFTFRNRKHHCRNCGNVFCGQCSAQSMPLPHLGITTPVRVCDSCFAGQKQVSNEAPVFDAAKMRPSWQQAPKPTQAKSNDHDDMELKRALELSLAESQRQDRPQVSRVEQKKPAQEEDDDDLKAAIEASLKETRQEAPREVYSYPTLSSSSNNYNVPPTGSQNVTQYTSVPDPPKSNSHELSSTEQDSINLFATLIERLKAEPKGAILRDSQIQELHESISALRPKLARSLGDTVGKYESLVETHSKLATAVKYYDQLLEARLASTYSRDAYAYDQPQFSSQDYYRQQDYSRPSQPPGNDHNPHAQQAPVQPYAPQSQTQTQANIYNAPDYEQEPSRPKEEVSLIDL